MSSDLASTVSEEISLDKSVAEFLRQHEAEHVFQRTCEFARSAFPALIGLEVILQEDPDEYARSRVVVCVRLPESFSDVEIHASMQRYHEQVIAQIPLDRCPLFALVTEFGSE
jgi:hypothetical protein